jgi:DNA-binding FadR family transcriptional regulator
MLLPRQAYPRRSLHGQVVREIGMQIVQGCFKPGEALPDEGTLLARFDVSRTVVRESLKVLAAKGLVESRPKIGTRVRPTFLWNRLDPDILGWQETDESQEAFLCSLTEVRRIVEPPAARLAAARATAGEIETVAQAYRGMADNIANIGAFMDADIRFHAAILEASHNEFLQPVTNAIRAAMLSSLRITNRDAALNSHSVSLHRVVLEAVKAKDPIRAERAMRRHLDDTWSRLQINLKGARKIP